MPPLFNPDTSPKRVAFVKLDAVFAPILSTTLLAGGINPGGRYVAHMTISLITPGSVSSVLGGIQGLQTEWTNESDGVIKQYRPKTPKVSAFNILSGSISESIMMDSKQGSDINYLVDYASVLANEMVYDLEIVLEKLD